MLPRDGCRRRAFSSGRWTACSPMNGRPRLPHGFASQWLRLQDARKNQPEPFLYPDFTNQLGADMVRETELLFEHLVLEDRSLLELLTADYTFVNDRLARHYGIPGVSGSEFRRVQYPPDTRRGVLSHGSFLLLTSMSARTSPVLRGKWVMEVLMGHAPASSTAQHTGARRNRGLFERSASDDARTDGEAPGRPDVQLVSPLHGPDRPGGWTATT